MSGINGEDDLKTRITESIKEFFHDNNYGFEIFAFIRMDTNTDTKTDEKTNIRFILKRIVLFEGFSQNANDEDSLKIKLRNEMAEVIRDKYLGEEFINGITPDIKYDEVKNVANRQANFYVIPQDATYRPFKMLKTVGASTPHYTASDIKSTQGIWFRFGRGNKVVWAYQHMYPNSFLNRKGLGSIIFPEEGDVFKELKKTPLLISQRVDLLVIGNEIISDNIELLQRYFGFQDFVEQTAKGVVSSIQGINFVENIEKVYAYIKRNKTIYARKMMRIKDSKVLQMRAEDLFNKINAVPRWKGVFKVDINIKKIKLKTFKDVENLIDLLDERYTRSDITGEEYDSGDGAKKWVEKRTTV